jgi:hypothetical protein
VVATLVSVVPVRFARNLVVQRFEVQTHFFNAPSDALNASDALCR